MIVIACSDLQALWVTCNAFQMAEWLHSKVTGLLGNMHYAVCKVEVSS